ncbi:heat shock protein 70 family [Zopfochytrium polystomum]|nr:heat shock protein 70 family [Zopfochytrium polystomum]
MSVVGVDFGNLNTVVAVARNRGIDVITNEVSNRATPSLVSFGDRQRYMGESAKTQEISNFKSTVSTLKRLIGRPFSDPEVLAVEQKFVNAKLVEGDSGEVAAEVQFQGQTRVFTMTQLTAMFLGQVKSFTQTEIKLPMSDCVISCPGWYTDRQRRALRDAAEIAGLNCLRVMNDLTAAALGYGITKVDLPDLALDPKAKPRNVLFVDLGHSSYQVAITSLVRGKLVVKAADYDHNLGGRDFDEVLVDHYVQEFDAKYKLDIRSSPKALFRLRQACEKVKKILSANSVTMLNVESLLDDKDVSAQVHKTEYSEWVKPLFDRLVAPVERVLSSAKMSAADIDFVELVGGSTRIPAVKDFLNEYFKGPKGENKLSTTLNQDEAVSRGCALQCAIISPVFKVRDFTVQDWNAFPIEFQWDPSCVSKGKDGEPDGRVDVFAAGSPIPSAKSLTFHRVFTDDELAAQTGTVSLDIAAYYSGSTGKLPLVESRRIGAFSVRGIRKLESNVSGEGPMTATIKVKARLDGSNLITVDGAQQIEEKLIEEEEPQQAEAEIESAESDANVTSSTESSGVQAAESPLTKKQKRVTVNHDLTVYSETGALSPSALKQLHNIELTMESADRLVIETAEARNQLEEYVYHARGQLDTEWSDHISNADRESFGKMLREMEDWLYGEGEDAEKAVYQEKLESLKAIGEPVAARYKEAEERPRAEKLFREFSADALDKLSGSNDRYAHIPAAERSKLAKQITAKVAWLDSSLAAIQQTPKHITPKVLVAQIHKEREALAAVVNPVLNRPKRAEPAPTAPPPKKDTQKKEKKERKEKREKKGEVQSEQGEGLVEEDAQVDEGGAEDDKMTTD